MRIKKVLSLIILALVMLTAGFFAGCGDKYSNMTIKLDKEEISLLLNGSAEEKSSTFTATISGIGEEISGDVVFEQTDSSVASFEVLSIENNVSTIKVTALLGGTTTAKVKSEEVPDRVFASIKINVVEEVKNIEYVPTFKPYVVISDPLMFTTEENKNFVPTKTILNAAEFIKFSPSTTTQKSIKYSLIGKYAGFKIDKATGFVYETDDALKVTEEGEVSFVGTMGHAGMAKIRATSASNPELFVEFDLKVLYPIENITNLGFSEGDNPIEEIILSNSRFREGIKSWKLDMGDTSEYNLVCWSDNDLILEVEKTSATTFTIRSGIEGTTNFHVRVEVIGYERHNTMATIPVRVVQFSEQVYIDGKVYQDSAKTMFVYDDYQNGLGVPINIKAGPLGAYNKKIVMQLNEIDKAKYLDANGYFNTKYLKLKYDSNTFVNITDIIDGSKNGTIIYAMSGGNFAETLDLKFLAQWTKRGTNDVIDEEVYSTINFNLKVGAKSISADYVDDKFYLSKGETSKFYYSLKGVDEDPNVFADQIFARIKDSTIASVAEITDVLLSEDENGKYVEITGLKEGATQIELSLNNGVKFLYDIFVFSPITNFTANIGTVEQNSNIAQIQLASDNGLTSVANATIKVGSVLNIEIGKYVLQNGNYNLANDGTVSSVNFEVTDNDANNEYVSVSNNGVLKAIQATPTDVFATVKVTIKYLVSNANGSVKLEEKTLSFDIKVYVPISNVELNTYEITLYDYETLGYFDKSKGKLKIYTNQYEEIVDKVNTALCLNVYPQNATNKVVQINSPNVDALEKGANNVFTAKSKLGMEIVLCDIEFIVQDFNVYYVKVCRVYVKFPNVSKTISLLNVERTTMIDDEEMPYLYFDARKGLNNSANTFNLQAKALGAQTLGATLLNSDLKYVYVTNKNDGLVNPVFTVDENGVITPLRAGVAYLDVIAKDSYINNEQYQVFKRICIKVADGLTPVTSIEIASATDFLQINTIDGLKLHYTIVNTLNFALVDFVPLGLIDNSIVEFTGSINGKFLNKNQTIIGLNFTHSSNEAINNYGLILNNKGTIKNLNINISNLNFNYSNANASSLNFGTICAQNNGTVENCNVKIINGLINTNVNANNIGAVAGLNNADSRIANCSVYGNLTVNQGTSVVSTQVFNVGGVVGNNLGVVVGNYDFYNSMQDFNNSNANANLILTFNKNNVSSEYHMDIESNSNFGLIAGYSEGNIKNLFATGSLIINGYSNAGGVAGFAKNSELLNNYFVGKVVANECVGGIAGKVENSTIKNCIVESFDEQNPVAFLKGTNYVGGLIGKATQTNIVNYCFVRSYVSKTINNGFEGDLIVKTTNDNPIFSSFIGNEDTINGNNFSHITMVKKIGANEPVVIERTALPDSMNNEDGKSMIVVVPNSLSININDTSIIKPIDILKQNKHIKVDANKLLLFYHTQENELYLNTFGIEKLLSVVFDPAIVNRANLSYSFANNNVVEILANGEFKIVGTGLTTLTIISQYNLLATSKINIEVVLSTSSVNLFEQADFSGEEIEELNIMKNGKVELFYSVVGNKNIWLEYTTDDSKIIDVVGETWNNNSVEMLITRTQMLEAKLKGMANITVKSFIKIKDSSSNEIKVYLPFAQSFTINVFEGTKSVNLSSESANISLKDIASTIVSVESDLNEEDISAKVLINEGKIVNQVEQWNTNSGTDYISYSLTKNADGKEVISFYVKENKKTDSYFDKEKTIKVKIFVKKIVTDKQITDGMFEEDIENLNNDYIIKDYVLTILPQKVSFIEMEYFCDAEQYVDENENISYNHNEIAGNIIKSGTVGILKIKLLPETSKQNIKEIKLTSTSNLGSISVQQLWFDEANAYPYTPVVPTPALINSGTYLLPQTKANGSFDGNIFVRCLIPSSITAGTVYNFTVECIHKDLTTKTKTLSLTVETPKKLNLTYKNSKEFLNTEFLPSDVEQKINLTLTKINDLTTLTIKAKYEENEIDINSLNIKKTSLKVNGTTTNVEYSINVPNSYNGKILSVYGSIQEKAGSKVITYLSNTLKLTVVKEVVEGITIKGAVEESEKVVLRKPYGSKYDLSFVVSTNAQTTNFENFDTQKNGTKLLYWFDGSNANLDLAKSYNNYKINSTTKTQIEPLRVSQDNFVGIFAYCYDEDGNIVPFNYFEANCLITGKERGRYIFNNQSVFIVNVKFSTDFYLQGSYENPVPIYNLEEFKSMRENGNYILMNDLFLENNFETVETKIKSFDGNGYNLTIGGFNNQKTETVAETGNFGLFAEIEEGTILKNITIQYVKQTEQNGVKTNANVELEIENYKNINFGGIVAVNNGGIIYNCKIKGFENSTDKYLKITTQAVLEDQSVATCIGGIVAQNAGYLTHSQVEDLKIVVNKGYLGGLAGQNSGNVSNCYVKNCIFEHTASTDTSTLTATSLLGGMTAVNGGTIRGSYVDCQNDGALTFNGLIGGFAVNNTGKIDECYSNVNMQSQVKTAGFVYSSLTGTISNCYSVCASTSASTSRAPFIGVDGTIILANSTKITNCYYLYSSNNVFPNYANYPATKLNNAELAEPYYLNGFIFRGENGIWKIENNLPNLLEANVIATSKQKLLKTETDKDSGELKYYYKIEDGTNEIGSKNNPIIIYSAEQFVNEVLKNNGEVVSTNYNNDKCFRLLCDIDLGNYVLNLTHDGKIYETTFSGSLEGNGFTISTIMLSAPQNIENIKNIGLFSKISGGTVKNLKLVPTQVYANNVQNVGALAGTITGNSTIVNIAVENDSVVVQGKNYVGGVAGVFEQNSVAENITSKISANASFKAESVLVNSYGSTANTGYAGAVFGIVNLNSVDKLSQAPIYNIKVNGNLKIFGQYAGTAFGFVGQNSYVDNVKVFIKTTNFIKATFSAGGVVGENRGYLSRCLIEHETNQIEIDNRIDKSTNLPSQNISFFVGNPKIIGGIVGFNNGGSIDNSYCKIDVRNQNSIYGGGVVGLICGGNLYSNYSTSSVLSLQYVGGIVGTASGRAQLAEEIEGEATPKTLFANGSVKLIVKNSNVNVINNIALNNWLTQVDNGLETLTHSSIVGFVEDGSNIAFEENYALKNSDLEGETYYKYCKGETGFEINTTKNSEIFIYFSSSMWNNSKLYSFALPTLKNVNSLNLQPEKSNFYSLKQISNIKELLSMGTSGTYTLIDNINIYGINWTGKDFTGTLNGTFKENKYSIVGLTKIGQSDLNTGLFATTKNATINGVKLVGINFNLTVGTSGDNTTSIGAFVGTATTSTFENCSLSGNIFIDNSENANIGKIAGTAYDTISVSNFTSLIEYYQTPDSQIPLENYGKLLLIQE